VVVVGKNLIFSMKKFGCLSKKKIFKKMEYEVIKIKKNTSIKIAQNCCFTKKRDRKKMGDNATT